METIPCEVCGTPTPVRGTKRCHNCWEVEGRLADYMKSPGGQDFVRGLLTPVDDWENEMWYEAVLKEHEATVEKTDKYWWSLGWRHGTMGFNTDNEIRARKMAALFIELWMRGFSASFADHIVSGFDLWLDIQENVEPVNPFGYGFRYDPHQMLVDTVQELYGVTPVNCQWVKAGCDRIEWPIDPTQGDPTICISSTSTVEETLEALIFQLAHVVIVRHFEGNTHELGNKWNEVVDRIRTEFHRQMDEKFPPV